MSRPPGRTSRPAPLASVRNRLVLLFFAITTAAVGFVYLYVVPQLSSSLTADRLERLEQQGSEELDRLGVVANRGLDQRELSTLVRRSAAKVDARVTLLGVRDGVPSFVVADSELESDAIDATYPAARGAAISGAVRSGVETVRGRRIGETAIPVPGGHPPSASTPAWIIILSTPLEDVESNVDLIRRQTLIAGAIALALALVAAWIAAGMHARRLRRLERAAERVARGDFSVPIPVGSRDEVGQLALTLDEMQRRLRRLDSARREFIANASHELRTPIASLGGFIELLDDDEEPDPETRRHFVQTMRGQIDRLTKLSTDLLDLSRLDADAMSLSSERFDLLDLAHDVADEFAAAAANHGTVIDVEPAEGQQPLVQADRARTMQIMRILIDNALKHTPAGTEITIASSSSTSECRLSVTDAGPGIDPRSRERVFERFFTADAVSGSGLGLAIARELARLMGGDVELEQTRRRRTCFVMALPRASAPAARA
jgi:two-component system OmpR family sensor kinase